MKSFFGNEVSSTSTQPPHNSNGSTGAFTPKGVPQPGQDGGMQVIGGSSPVGRKDGNTTKVVGAFGAGVPTPKEVTSNNEKNFESNQQTLANPVEAPKLISEIIKTDDKVANNPLNFANKYLGLDENNPEHQKTIQGFLNSAIPGLLENASGVTQNKNAWCSAFVNSILNEGGFDTLNPGKDAYNLIRAQKYSTIGEAVEGETKSGIDQAKPGDIVVMQGLGGGFHVGFYSGTNNGNVVILGGNQNNRVSLKELLPGKQAIVAVRRVNGVEELKPGKLDDILATEHYDNKSQSSTR